MSYLTQLKWLPSKQSHYFKILLFVVIVGAVNMGGSWLTHQIDFQIFSRHEPLLHGFLLGSIALYVLLMAIPFMPGIEIGLALMILLGNKGAILIYLCTVISLSISFLIGRKIDPLHIYRLLDWFHLYKASLFVQQLEPLNPRERLELLYNKSPSKIAPFLLKHRYMAIAVLLNLPGNALIGGGGGIGLILGMSKIIPFHVYAVLVAIAVAPVPLLFFLHGF